jgi:hypothetical protein
VPDAASAGARDIPLGVRRRARRLAWVYLLDDPSAELTPQLIVEVIRDVAFHYFTRLAPASPGDGH